MIDLAVEGDSLPNDPTRCVSYNRPNVLRIGRPEQEGQLATLRIAHDDYTIRINLRLGLQPLDGPPEILQGYLHKLARQAFDPEVRKRQRRVTHRRKRLHTAFPKPASHPAEGYHRR